MELQRADVGLGSNVRSIAQVRRTIAERLIGLPDDSLDLVLVLASELVTNAVRHGAGLVSLHVTWSDGCVRVEVQDRSPEWPVVRAMDGEALDGRGLFIVDALSSGWGVRPGATGKTVWFTVDG